MASAFAIDGNVTTRWGGAFSAGHWLQVDLGSVASVAGALIRWDSGFAAAYLIQGSRDGHDWFTAYETSDAQGGIDYVFFPPVQTRYLRLASVPRTADWGVSENNRRARFYSLTRAGRKQVEAEVAKWERLSAGVNLVLLRT